VKKIINCWAHCTRKDTQVDEFIEYFKNFIEDKPGWFEGFSIGDPSQTNGLEGSHKDIKQFEGIKARSPTIKFLKGKGTHLVEEWSKVRSPTFTRLDSTVLVNPNIVYHSMNYL